MPPFSQNVSKAQERKMFVLEDQGKLAPGEAVGRARATKGNFHNLPQHVGHKAKAKHGMPASLRALGRLSDPDRDKDSRKHDPDQDNG